ncbi:IS3 family transposase [Streptomyces sp. NPDC101194]|uniref:IS3 family transposase n=1 Tax=Streptomyces sp. NPDC101194 TaxID=3366127 RepID=UPI00382489B4
MYSILRPLTSPEKNDPTWGGPDTGAVRVRCPYRKTRCADALRSRRPRGRARRAASMRPAGLEGVIRGQRRRTTIPEPTTPRPPDLVNRRFAASRPNQLWVVDLSCIRTWSGWVYAAFALDVYSRMIVGWQLATHMRTDLPLDAPEMALWRRGTKKGSGLIHHSDRGSRYVSIRYGERLLEAGAAASVGSVADSYGNAMAEVLNGSSKAEPIEHQGSWRDVDQAEHAVVQWVGRYNTERLHSALTSHPRNSRPRTTVPW